MHILSVQGAGGDISSAVKAGARSYLLKDVLPEELIHAIRMVYRGQRYFPPLLATRLAENLEQETLTPKELQVLELISQGKTNKQVGEILQTSEGTVKIHVKRILGKLGVETRSAAAHEAYRRGIVHFKP